MKINKDLINELKALDDAGLWSKIRSMASKYGYTLPEEIPPKKDMQSLRSVMENIDKINVTDIARLLSTFKAKKRQ